MDSLSLYATFRTGLKKVMPFLLLGFLLCLSPPLFSRSFLEFQEDSLRVGELVPLYMRIDHAPNEVVVFPDTANDFGVFEVVRTRPSLTRTLEGRSTDAIIYYVRTFDLDDHMVIQLPYALILEGDTLIKSLESDTVFLSRQVASIQPPPPFRARRDLVPMQDPPNHGLNFLLILGSLSLLGVSYWFLKKPLQRFFDLRRLNRQWLSVNSKLNLLPPGEAGPFLDGLNRIWKDYLDLRASHTLRSLTTTELKHVLPELAELRGEEGNELLLITREGDRVIYAEEAISEKQCEALRKQVRTILEAVHQRRKEALT